MPRWRHLSARCALPTSSHLAPIPGAEETFAFLRARGIKIATDTGFDATIGGLIMERLNWPGRLIDLAVFSSDVSVGVPLPT